MSNEKQSLRHANCNLHEHRVNVIKLKNRIIETEIGLICFKIHVLRFVDMIEDSDYH